MSYPKIVGFRGSTPYPWLRILDTTDARAFDLGVVVPGNTVTNYDGYWFNLGPAQLHDPQLSLVPHPVLDLGANADTIDVMKLGASDTDLLGFSTPAKATNTAGWAVPLADPFLPWADRFQCGISWSPGAMATPGMIRKAFQWDGGYFPDTWDYMWAPLANQEFPYSAMYDFPMSLLEGPESHHEKIEAEPGTLTGYRLNLWNPATPGDYIYYDHPHSPGNPWYDNIDNATGYIIKTKVKWHGSGEGYPFGIWCRDGSRTWKMRWNRDGATIRLSTLIADGFAADQHYNINDSYREIKIAVQDTTFQLYVDTVPAITATIAASSSVKNIQFGGIEKPPSGTHWGTTYWQYFKFYTGGIVEPLY